ncbi:uracil-DNA glycosylase [bacterium]|nr:uracil-DNA glycosylase [bacterium]
MDLKKKLIKLLEFRRELGEDYLIMPSWNEPEKVPVDKKATSREKVEFKSGVTGKADMKIEENENANNQAKSALEKHYQEIKDCQLCPLHETRHKFVYGIGNPQADLMFIGEAPGKDEDLRGVPFVGAAGGLFDKILKVVELSRDEIYIANILKCRPPKNRDPLPSEVSKCIPYLNRQIEIIKPRIICALGRVAAQNLLDTNLPLGRLRGEIHFFNRIPLVVTYHPAALLRNSNFKKPAWEDFKWIKQLCDNPGQITPYQPEPPKKLSLGL